MNEMVFTLLKEGKTEELITELENNPAAIFAVDAHGVSLLLLSFYYRNTTISDYLLRRRKELTVFEACAAGDLQVVTRILANDNTLLNAYATDGFTPLTLACFFAREGVVNYLLEQKADVNQAASNSFLVAPIHSAAAANSLAIVTTLLQHGANARAKQQGNFTPLHSAVQNNNAAMVRLLLQYDADASAKNDAGMSPFDLAVRADRQDIIAILAPRKS